MGKAVYRERFTKLSLQIKRFGNLKKVKENYTKKHCAQKITTKQIIRKLKGYVLGTRLSLLLAI